MTVIKAGYSISISFLLAGKVSSQHTLRGRLPGPWFPEQQGLLLGPSQEVKHPLEWLFQAKKKFHPLLLLILQIIAQRHLGPDLAYCGPGHHQVVHGGQQ